MKILQKRLNSKGEVDKNVRHEIETAKKLRRIRNHPYVVCIGFSDVCNVL